MREIKKVLTVLGFFFVRSLFSFPNIRPAPNTKRLPVTQSGTERKQTQNIYETQ